ncbi:Ren protein [Escherichia coli P12b]|nr:Ren protein [Escherichia coli P12b]
MKRVLAFYRGNFQ